MTELLLLTGANGRTGRAVLKSMVKARIPVRAFIRDAAQEKALLDLGASECVVGDLNDAASINSAAAGVTKILHIGPPMHPDELAITERLVAASKAEDINQFIYYSVMHPLRREVRHHRLKLDAEEQLIESGVPYTILQPSRYMQHVDPLWPRIVEDGIHAMPFDIGKPFSVVDLADLADACAVVAGSESHLFATYELAGPEALSQSDMAQIIENEIKRPVQAQAVPLDVVEEKARAAGANDDRIEQMVIMNRHYDSHGFLGNSNVLEYLLGRPANRYRSYIQSLSRR